MCLRLAQLSLAVLLAFGVAAGANAQSAPIKRGDGTVLPVWNNTSGKLEAYLLLEPTGKAQTGTRWRFGGNTLDAAFGLQSGDSLALLCNRQSGIASALGSLANNCLLAALDDDATSGSGGSRRGSASMSLGRDGGRLGLTGGKSRDALPAWLTGTRSVPAQLDINDLTVFAQKNIGREGVVEIAGTLAHARLISPAEASTFGFADDWSSKTLSVSGGYGDFGASIVGHVVDVPGQPKWEGLGLGLTWRTPWSGQLTVGADNLVTRGKNPFSPGSDLSQEEGAVPYVRYEQDL